MISSADILNARILVVDDREANVRLLEGMLSGAGYACIGHPQHERPPHFPFSWRCRFPADLAALFARVLVSSTQRRRRLAAIALVAQFAGCAHRPPNGGEWASDLAVRPGSSLPREGASQPQVITLFEVSQQRVVGKQFFVAGVGYVAFNGGGSTMAGPNRKLDPFVELTVADHRDPRLAACRALLVPASFVDHAVQISGTGHFAALPGVNTRQLAVLRLETLSGCTLVLRRWTTLSLRASAACHAEEAEPRRRA